MSRGKVESVGREKDEGMRRHERLKDVKSFQVAVERLAAAQGGGSVLKLQGYFGAPAL